MIFPYLKKPVKITYPDSDPFGVKSRTDFLELIKILLRGQTVEWAKNSTGQVNDRSSPNGK